MSEWPARGLFAALVVACVVGAASSPAVVVASGPVSIVDAGGPRVRWVLALEASQRAARGDSAADRSRWLARLGAETTGATALHVLATIRLAEHDTTGADSCWRALTVRTSPWQLDAVLRHSEWVETRSGVARAESLLARVTLFEPTEPERAALLARRMALRAAVGNRDGAQVLAREIVRLYPALPPYAGRALSLLDSLAAAGGDSLTVEDLQAGAEVDVFRGARSSAVARLRRVIARTERAQKSAPTYRLAQVLLDARMPLAAGAAVDSLVALRAEMDPDERALYELLRARTRRAAGATDSALAQYARIGRSAAGPTSRATAWWEYAREAQDRMRYREALEGFSRASQIGGLRAEDARFQAGLVHFVLGQPDTACSWWRRAHGENARFWLAIALRPTDRATSDSLLRGLAALPGYGFYRAAARETLGVAGWSASGDCAFARLVPGQALADDVHELLADGRDADAASLIRRWSDNDPRVRSEGDRDAPAVLALASYAYDAGRYALGTRLVELLTSDPRFEAVAWTVVPWAYPPAFEAEVGAAESLGVERSLLWALMRQESRFDPKARSRSDALGLTQLKLGAAQDAALMLHEPPPGEPALLEPNRSIRYGARYLAQLVRRFDGCVPVALAAYNAGASTIRRDWRELVSRGGGALYCELASNADSQDYTRRIMGFRSAYRELRPTTAR